MPVAGLRLLVYDDGAGICLYVRLASAHRILVDCRRQSSYLSLKFLRNLGELGPLTPLSQYLRPLSCAPCLDSWLKAVNLLRGLVFRPGGSWIIWQPMPSPGPGFRLKAKVFSRTKMPKPRGMEGLPPLLVLGLSADQIEGLGGPPGAWAANSSLALKFSLPGEKGLLLGGDLRPPAWQTLLTDQEIRGLLAGTSFFAAGSPDRGYDLARSLKMAALPWLILGSLGQKAPWISQGFSRSCFETPKVGAMVIDVDETGGLDIQAWPWADNHLVYRGLARPLGDPALPAPWPVLKALNNITGSSFNWI
jgi:hypothetical protein